VPISTKFWLDSFCEEQANIFKILNQFFNLLKRGGKCQKTGDNSMFYSDFMLFLKFLCISEKKNWEKETKKKQLNA